MIDLNLVIDGVVAALLAVTLIYCVILNRRLSVMRHAQSDLRGLVAEFNHATEKAKSGVMELKKSSGEAGKALQLEMKQARGLADELRFIAESADRVAQRLDASIGQARGNRPTAGVSKPQPMRDETGAKMRSHVEKELLHALRQAR